MMMANGVPLIQDQVSDVITAGASLLPRRLERAESSSEE